MTASQPASVLCLLSPARRRGLRPAAVVTGLDVGVFDATRCGSRPRAPAAALVAAHERVGLRTDNAVGGQSAVGLQAPDGGGGQRAEAPVDSRSPEAVAAAPQHALDAPDGGARRVAHAGALGEHRGGVVAARAARGRRRSSRPRPRPAPAAPSCRLRSPKQATSFVVIATPFETSHRDAGPMRGAAWCTHRAAPSGDATGARRGPEGVSQAVPGGGRRTRATATARATADGE